MSSTEIKLGDRVRLNELGISRCPRIRIRNGVVVALSGHNSRSASLGILFAGNKRATRIHTSYVERDDAEAKDK
jgi:hypothetical protein